MSTVPLPLSHVRTGRRPVSARALGLAAVSLFGAAFAVAGLGGHWVLAFWALSGLFPLVTPASLSACIAATVDGSGSWPVVGLTGAACVVGLAALLRAMGSLERL